MRRGPEEELDGAQILDRANKVFERLSDRDRQIWEDRQEGDTLRTIATKFGLSGTRIRQIEKTIKRRLRRQLMYWNPNYVLPKTIPEKMSINPKPEAADNKANRIRKLLLHRSFMIESIKKKAKKDVAREQGFFIMYERKGWSKEYANAVAKLKRCLYER